MRKTIENIILTSAALVALGAGLVSGACKRDYDITPTEPPGIHESAPNETTIEETIPPEIAEPYKLYAPTTTPEEFEKFNSALEKAYNKVTEIYGIKPNLQFVAFISTDKQSYSLGFRDNKSDEKINQSILSADSLGYRISDFHEDQEKERGIKHEMAHSFNKTSFPTYHSWFDEGMAMYASGELDHPGYSRNYTELKAKENEWWVERNTPNVNPGHLIGSSFFTALQIEYNMTSEQNRTALNLLRINYLEMGKELTKQDIETAYETALGVSLDPLFELLRPGVMLLYSDKYESGRKIKSEF